MDARRPTERPPDDFRTNPATCKANIHLMPIDHLAAGRTKDLGGGFLVRRLLPAFPRQGVGPFVFFDHFGPVNVQPHDNFDVRPHPHIGLATVTYLFEGAMLHRDSLGHVQRIEPGAINWMTAGRGIVHSERRPPDLAQTPYASHGLQLWARCRGMRRRPRHRSRTRRRARSPNGARGATTCAC